MVGYMGVGKSASGRRLARLMGVPFFDTDEALRSQHGGTIPQLFAQHGQGGFRQLERKVLMDMATAHPDALISTGGGAACHADNMDFMRANGVVVYLKMGADDLADRLQGKSDERPLLAGVSAEALPQFIAKHLAEREVHYRKANITVDAAHLDGERLNSVRNLIEAEWAVKP